MGPKTNRKRTSSRLWVAMVAALVIGAGLWIGLRPALAAAPAHPAQEQAAPAPAAPAAKPAAQPTTCQNCHQGIENYHTSATAANISCTKCHGGNGEGKTQAEAHVLPRKGSIFYGRKGALPTDSYALLNLESPEYIQFVNPSDFRVADKTCGPCHKQITASVKKNIMATNAMVHNAVFYDNGSVPFKVAHYGEAYTPDGKAASIIPNPPPTREAEDRGALKQLFPHPNFEVTKIVDPLRVAEVDQAALGDRGPGTQARIEGTFLNVLKTRLNDPTLWLMGPNAWPGDYRASGCDGCHVMYANSRDETARDWAKYGNTGQSATGDKNIPKGVSGYPIKHQITTSMPPIQCLTCHYHQGNGALDTYVGAVWWDRESDSDIVKKLKAEDEYGPGQTELATHNGEMKHVQFTDYHAHGWNFQKVYKMDTKGQLLDAKGQVIPDNDPDKFKKAVHLKDIHFEKGMDCVDCHTKQDMHGDGNMYSQMTDAIEIRCEDCHGTVDHRATLITSGMGANGKHDLQDLSTPTGGPQFEMDGDKVIQHSMRDPNLQWEIKQVVDIVNPASPVYNPKAAYAKLMTTSGTVGQASAGPDGLAHSTKKMECYACHSSWQTTCSGCHLPLDVNKKTRELHFEPTMSKAYAPYYRQVIRTDLNFLGIGTYNHGYKVTPFRPASAVVVSALDGDRNNIIHQQPLVSSPGFTNDGYTPHPPHTVRTQETKECTDCHMSQDNSNNARIASNLGFGINAMNFIGEFQYVAEKGSGLRAVKVTEGDEPQPVIGSTFDKVLYPESYNRFVSGGRKLRTSYGRRAPLIQALTVRGEYVLTAEGPAGYKLYDIANINNKAAAQRIVQHENTGLGEHTVVRSPNATYIYVPSSLPMALGRTPVAANHEQPIHPLYRYAYGTDSKDGLVLIDINTLTDIDPENNRLKRNVVFNPDGKLSGAQMVETYGHYAFVVSDQTGLSVVNIDDPTKPKLAFSSNAGLDGAHAIELQLRYAFVLDRAGMKVFDITNPEQPVQVQGASVAIPDTHGMTLFRTTAYIAAGKQGLAMVDVTDPEKPGAPTFFNAGGAISDARDVAVGETNVSFFAYVADGKGGMKIVKLIDTDTPGYMGFAPTPQPELIASYQGAGETVAVSRGAIRDRYVDESGDQISVTNRMGSRPFNAEELRRILFMPDGQVLKVTNEPPSAKAQQKSTGAAAPGGGTR